MPDPITGPVFRWAREQSGATESEYPPRMSTTPNAEQFTIRRKIFKIFGAAFHIYDARGEVVGYCKQKAFRLREDIRIYTDDSCTKELLTIRARNIIDFAATYDVCLASGEQIASFRRKGLSSTFVRDHWLVFGPDDQPLGEIRELGGMAALLRRWVDLVSLFSPPTFEVVSPSGQPVALLRQHFNWFVYRLGVSIFPDAAKEGWDDLVVLAGGCLIAAIEGRQDAD